MVVGSGKLWVHRALTHRKPAASSGSLPHVVVSEAPPVDCSRGLRGVVGLDSTVVVLPLDRRQVAEAGVESPVVVGVDPGEARRADPEVELPRSRGHLILGETLEEGGPCGSSSEVPARVPS